MKRRTIILVSALMAAMTSMAFPTENYAAESRLSSGHWVKISTDRDGVFQLTYDQLRQLGFDNPERVQVYGYGATKFVGHEFSTTDPDDLPPYATMHTDDGRIIFFGQGDVTAYTRSVDGYAESAVVVERNTYDTRSYYFLTDAYGTTDVPVKTNAPLGQRILKSHIHLELRETEAIMPSTGGAVFHGNKCNPGDKVVEQFRIRNFKPSTEAKVGIFSYLAGIRTTTSCRMSMTASSNITVTSYAHTTASAISEGNYDQYRDARGYAIFTPADATVDDLSESDASFTLSFPTENFSYAAMDRAYIRYPRANKLDDVDPALVMNLHNKENLRGTGIQFEASSISDVVLWNIDNPAAIVAYQPVVYDNMSQTTTFVLSEPITRLVAFRPTATFPSPEIIGDVTPQNLHALETPDMVIITTAALQAQAERLAAIHRANQGMDVVVVEQSKIYNEFSSGSRDAMGYRRFVKMLYDRNPDKLKYVLLMGVGSYDNRCVLGSYVDRLVAYETTDKTQARNSVTAYSSDNIFGMLDDKYDHDKIEFAPMQVAVGRIPAVTPGEAESYVRKVEQFFQTPMTIDDAQRVLVIGGEGDSNTHVRQGDEVVSEMSGIDPTLTMIPLYTQAYASPGCDQDASRNITHEEFERGLGYLTYIGHGGPTYVSIFNVLNTLYASTVVNSVMPFVMFSSCDQYAFDHLSSGLLETLLFNENGGVLAGVGATRSVYIPYNQHTCLSIAKAYASRKPGDTYGDLFLVARDNLISANSTGTTNEPLMINNMAYSFGGDPAIPVVAQSCKSVITSVNGEVAGSTITIAPLKDTVIEGMVTDSDGNLLSDFNGTAVITVYDSPRSEATYNMLNEERFTPFEFTCDYDRLAYVKTEVKSGKFSATLNVPVPATPDATHHINIGADSETGDLHAYGSVKKVKIKDYDPADYDDVVFDAPAILEFYADSPEFNSGDEVGSDVNIVAIIEPSSSGIRISSGSIATVSNLNLDNVNVYSNLSANISPVGDGTMRLSYPLRGLTDGQHSLKLTITNNAGESAVSIIDFVVVTRGLEGSLEVTPEVARTEAVISLEGASASSNRLIIRDAAGNTVFSAQDVAFPYTWNLKDMDGNAVSDGVYSASALLNDGSNYGSTAAVQIIVIR